MSRLIARGSVLLTGAWAWVSPLCAHVSINVVVFGVWVVGACGVVGFEIRLDCGLVMLLR